MRNEKAAIEFVAKHTTIPVPNILFYIDEGDRIYLGLEKVEGVTMDKIEDANDKAKIIQQLDGFVEELAKLRSLRSRALFPRLAFLSRSRNIATSPRLSSL